MNTSTLFCPCSSGDAGPAEEGAPLSGLIKGIIKNLGGGGRPTEEEMAEKWKDAVGKAAFKHSRPVSFKKLSLTVNVDGSSWLYELTTRKREILKKLEGSLGRKKLKEIRFRIGEIKKV